MHYVLRIVALLIAVPILLVGLAFGVFSVLWPPNAGQPIAEAWEIPHPTVVAHRGASWDAPESTAPAYELARDMGAHYLEADLQRTRDSVIVVFHDRTLRRTTNVEEVFPERADDTFEMFTYDELLELDHGSWFNEAFPERACDCFEGLGPVTLQQLIEIAEGGNNNPGLYLETKDAVIHPGIEDDILAILEEAGWLPEAPSPETPARDVNAQIGAPTVNLATGHARIIFQSFHAPSVATLAERAPDLPAVYLISRSMAEADGLGYHLDRAVDMGAAGIGPVGTLGYPWHTGPAHRRDLLAHHYTINNPWRMRVLRWFGSDGIFTDRPALALEVYNYADDIDIEALLEPLGY